MKYGKFVIGMLLLAIASCQQPHTKNAFDQTNPDVKVAGAMKNVMWKGELAGSIFLDTITDKKGLYGLGPASFLTGEIMINDGQSYVSRVLSDSAISIANTFDIAAPFLVYTNVYEWKQIELPSDVKNIGDLEKLIDQQTKDYKRPFAFKLAGTVSSAVIHIQNLPLGSKVSSPDEAHQGQTNYNILDESVTVIGFFSKEHQGVFTHHDSFLHMHLLNADESKMGHLDELIIDQMKLYLPVE